MGQLAKNDNYIETITLEEYKALDNLSKVLYFIEASIKQANMLLAELNDQEKENLKELFYGYAEAVIRFVKTFTMEAEKEMQKLNEVSTEKANKAHILATLRKNKLLKTIANENLFVANIGLLTNGFREKGRLDILHQIITATFENEVLKKKYEELDAHVAGE